MAGRPSREAPWIRDQKLLAVQRLGCLLGGGEGGQVAFVPAPWRHPRSPSWAWLSCGQVATFWE